MSDQFVDQEEASEVADYAGRRPYQRRRSRLASSGGWMGGAILIALGLIFLFQNMGALPVANWWALFILIPAAGAFSRAFNVYHTSGRFTAQARGSFWAGIVLSLVTAMFLFELNWITLGPVLLILAGAGLLINALLPW
jgi:hypothetical protein